MSRRFTLPMMFALLMGAVATPTWAQLRYTSTTRMEMGGTLGRMMSLMPGVGDPTREVTSIQGSRIRNDSENSSTIMDWDSGTMTMLDHESRTFMRFDFAQMMEGMAATVNEGMAQARAEAEQAGVEGADASSAPQLQAEVSLDRTGRTEKVAGYEADQVILTMTLAPSEEAAAENPELEGAQMVVVTELWLSTDFPEAQLMEAMRGEAMDRMRESFAARGGAASSMEAMSAFDPRLKGAWAKNAEELAKMEGTALRTTMHFVSVPPGVEFDRERVLENADQALASGAGAAVAGSAADAAKKALGGLAGRFGRKKQPEPEPEEAPAMTQSVFMRVVTEVEDVESGDLDPALFQVPDGYTERSMPSGGSLRP